MSGYPPPYGYDEGKRSATTSLVLGILALVLPIPIVGLILGICGLVAASNARRNGYDEGLRTAGFVCSLIGTLLNVITSCVVCASCMAFV